MREIDIETATEMGKEKINERERKSILSCWTEQERENEWKREQLILYTFLELLCCFSPLFVCVCVHAGIYICKYHCIYLYTQTETYMHIHIPISLLCRKTHMHLYSYKCLYILRYNWIWTYPCISQLSKPTSCGTLVWH